MKANKIHPTKLDSSPRDHDPENNDLFSPIMDSIQPQKSKISQKNLSTPSGLDNFKKFFNDFTKEAVSINYRETVRNEKEESQSSDPQHKWMLTLRILKDLLALNFQILLFFLNILSVINFILISEYRLGQMDITSEDSLIKVEWVIAANFSLEIILSVVLARGSLFKKIRKLLAVHNIINYLLIIEIIDTTVYSSRFVRRGIFYMLVTVFRSAKLNKVRETGSSILKEINFLFKKEKEYHIDSAKDQSDVKYFVYSSSLEIVIGIFQEATLCMAINEALDYQGYGNSNGVIVFDYKAAYYSVIVSMTSIGYGDIFPKLWPTRLCTICLLFVDISVLSNYIGQMTEYMYRLSPFIRNIKFENHIVIIGDMPLTFLKYFIKELNQVDFLTTKVYNSAEKEKKKLTASKMIVIGSENPAKELETWLEDFSESHVEIKYLKSNSLETLWFKQANLNSARHLFAFSMQQNETEDQCFESDKKMSYNVLEVVNRFPNLEITLVLSTDFTNQIKKDSLWTKVNVMSAQIINEYVMANSIENQGINVWLTHLSTLREKSLTASNGTVLQELEDYSSNMNQEIYPISNLLFFNIKIITLYSLL